MEKPDIEKLPKNIEAEQALIGALLVNNKFYEKIEGVLRPAHFADSTHRKIFEAMDKLLHAQRTADIITLKSYFEQEGTLEQVGGFSYLVKLAESASPLTNIEHYAQFIYDRYLRRELINTGYEIITDAMEENLDVSATDQISAAEKSLYNLSAQGDAKGGFIDFENALQSSVEVIQKAYQKGGRISGLPTGLSKLDYKIGGLNDSELLILAARPAMGKTALAVNIAYNVASYFSEHSEIPADKRGVAFFSLEMSSDELAARILSTTTHTPGQKLRNGELDESEFARIAAAVRELGNIPLYIDDTPGVSINAIRSRARRLKRTKGLGLIVIDYIQLIGGTGDKKSESNRVQEVSEISRGLKILAKELKIPVIALSQLNRSVEARDDKHPQMSDLRESGSIEQDADIVMFIYRENYYLQQAKPKQKDGDDPVKFQQKYSDWEIKCRQTQNEADVIVGKNRHGPIGEVKLYYNGEYTQFDNLAEVDKLPEQH